MIQKIYDFLTPETVVTYLQKQINEKLVKAKEKSKIYEPLTKLTDLETPVMWNIEQTENEEKDSWSYVYTGIKTEGVVELLLALKVFKTGDTILPWGSSSVTNEQVVKDEKKDDEKRELNDF